MDTFIVTVMIDHIFTFTVNTVIIISIIIVMLMLSGWTLWKTSKPRAMLRISRRGKELRTRDCESFYFLVFFYSSCCRCRCRCHCRCRHHHHHHLLPPPPHPHHPHHPLHHHQDHYGICSFAQLGEGIASLLGVGGDQIARAGETIGISSILTRLYKSNIFHVGGSHIISNNLVFHLDNLFLVYKYDSLRVLALYFFTAQSIFGRTNMIQ